MPRAWRMAPGIEGYDGIANMQFNGTHNGMAADRQLRAANGMAEKASLSLADDNGAPTRALAQRTTNEHACVENDPERPLFSLF
jgi:hypothetical protein